MFFSRLGGRQGSSAPDSRAGGDDLGEKGANAKGGGSISGNFDPTALERGAKALKQLDSSPNAQKAFEIIKLQETTRQKELERDIEQSSAYRSKANLERTRLEADERRKTITHQQEEERATSQYKAKLETEAYYKKLKEKESQNARILKQQHDKFLEQEEIRKRNEREILDMRRRQMEHENKLEQENIKVRVREETIGRIRAERENADIRLSEIRAKATESRTTHLESIKTIFGGIQEMGSSLYQDKSKLTMLVGGITAMAFGLFGAKNATRVAANLVETNFGKPSLIRETNMSFLAKHGLTLRRGLLFSPALTYRLFGQRSRLLKRPKVFEDIVLPLELENRLKWTVSTLVNSKRFGVPFRNMLLWGEPGTGKTMFARKLARESQLDYAIMSGGDVGQLGHRGVTELNKVFDWARKSKKGLLLFIDEAEAFLSKGRELSGSGKSESSRNALSAFLHQTGTESKNICVLLATNIPEALDKAVVDRVDEVFEFPSPGLDERFKLIKQFLEFHFDSSFTSQKCFKPLLSNSIRIHPSLDQAFLEHLAEKTVGFSGRQLYKLVLGMKSIVLGSGAESLTREIAESALSWKLEGDRHLGLRSPSSSQPLPSSPG